MLFPKVKTGSNKLNLQQRRSRLDGRQKGAEYKDDNEWNSLSEKAMKSASLRF